MEYNMDRLKKMSVEALIDFDKFCKDNNLTYSIAFGTELGAIRHKGFIPWDDDLDVDMPIKDYVKLRKLWNKSEYGKKYFLQCKENELYKPTVFYQIRQNGTTWIDPGKENIPMHWGIAIVDVFPVYYRPKNKKLWRIQRKLHSLAIAKCVFAYSNENTSVIKKKISRLETLFFLKSVKVMSDIFKNSGLFFYPDGYSKEKDLPEEVFYPVAPIKFENIQFNGHADYDKYLTLMYGEYMTPPPEHERDGHPIGIIDLDSDYTNYIKK